jgi:uncharacterized protein (TIGR00369 family)
MNLTIAAKVKGIFDNANFLRHLGMELTHVGQDYVETRLVPKEEHKQQHGYVHAGVIATMGDHTAGCAARGVLDEVQDVITVEFKINYFRPAVGEFLRCRGKVLRAGKSIIVAEAEIFSSNKGEEKLVAKLTETLQVIGGK